MLVRNLRGCGYRVVVALDEEDALERVEGGGVPAELVMVNLVGKAAGETLAVGRRVREHALRWAYASFVALGLLYFPSKVGFHLSPRPCQLAFDFALAVHSLTNFAHIILFALFFVMTSAQFRALNRRAFVWSAAATIMMGVLVEAAQGVTGEGNCRLRDLIPDGVGILAGSAVVLILRRVGWRPRPTRSLAWWRDARRRHAPDALPRSSGR